MTSVRTIVLTAIMILASLSHAGEPLSPTVLAGLDSDSARVRIATLVAISKSEDPNARRYLEGMLVDKDDKVRAASCEGLEKLGDPAALAAIEPMLKDKSKLVVKIAKRAKSTLEKKAKEIGFVGTGAVVAADISDVKDVSGLAAPGIVERLQTNVKAALLADKRMSVDVREVPASDGYGLQLRVRSVEESMQGDATIVSVKCEMTLVKLPEKALRLQSTATAGAGLEGQLSDAEKASLQTDAVDACAPELAKDFVDYALTRTR